VVRKSKVKVTGSQVIKEFLFLLAMYAYVRIRECKGTATLQQPTFRLPPIVVNVRVKVIITTTK